MRQHVAHKRTFFFLEQLILKHGADESCVNVKEMHEVRVLRSCLAAAAQLQQGSACHVGAMSSCWDGYMTDAHTQSGCINILTYCVLGLCWSRSKLARRPDAPA